MKLSNTCTQEVKFTLKLMYLFQPILLIKTVCLLCS